MVSNPQRSTRGWLCLWVRENLEVKHVPAPPTAGQKIRTGLTQTPSPTRKPNRLCLKLRPNPARNRGVQRTPTHPHRHVPSPRLPGLDRVFLPREKAESAVCPWNTSCSWHLLHAGGGVTLCPSCGKPERPLLRLSGRTLLHLRENCLLRQTVLKIACFA